MEAARRVSKDEMIANTWINSMVNAATLDTMMVFLARLIADQTGRPYKEVMKDMETDRDRRVDQYLRGASRPGQ